MRLDAIVLLIIKAFFAEDKYNLKIGEAAKILHSVGYPPNDIAIMLGKKNSTEISPYLYPKKK
jgi:hypothetical protein